ncbi:hypothetical protein [Yoonia maritima]|uniref:hypothetical protein n=1 Tax=Yoonia maritima TaxID=1435347 RepID=UPI000D0FC000|nr:hypothetical protein [Yoonia maritima]
MNTANFAKVVLLAAASVSLSGCETSSKGGITDGGLDGGTLRDGLANIWIDPDGCQHWYIDDGIEGYMTPRLRPDGRPYCQEERGEIVLKDGSVMMAEQEPVPSET